MNGTKSTQPRLIRRATPEDAERWNAFLDRSPAGSFYLRHEWLAINREVLGHDTPSFLAEADGEVVGVLPLVRVRSRLFGDILASMPFVNFGGPAAEDPEVERELVEAAVGEADRSGCDYLEIRSDRTFGDLPSTSQKVSMTIELPPDPEALWDAFTSKHRNNVKRAYRNELRVESGGIDLLDDFYHLMELGWRELGTPLYARRYFRAILDAFGEDVRIYVAYQGADPVASAFNGSFGQTCEGMWAAGAPAYRELQANYVLYWEMIQDACRSGFRRFHLGRSTVDSGAARFKARWMAEPTPLHWSYGLVGAQELPGLNPENPKYRFAIRCWRRLPLRIARTLGPPLARLIP